MLMNKHFFLCKVLLICRLCSLARPSDHEHLLMADPEMNPESVSSFFSSFTGRKSLTQKWEVCTLSSYSYSYSVWLNQKLVFVSFNTI